VNKELENIWKETWIEGDVSQKYIFFFIIKYYAKWPVTVSLHLFNGLPT
jgi:hypothetical protein